MFNSHSFPFIVYTAVSSLVQLDSLLLDPLIGLPPLLCAGKIEVDVATFPHERRNVEGGDALPFLQHGTNSLVGEDAAQFIDHGVHPPIPTLNGIHVCHPSDQHSIGGEQMVGQLEYATIDHTDNRLMDGHLIDGVPFALRQGKI